MKVSEAFEQQLTLDLHHELNSNPTLSNLWVAAKRHYVDEDKMLIKSEIAQHVVDKLDFNFVTMHLLNHFSDHIRQHRNLLNASSELPEKPMMDPKQVCSQSNRRRVTFQILRRNAQKEVFPFPELKTNAVFQYRNNEILLNNVPIKRMIKIPRP